MIEPCILTKKSFIGWLKWIEESRHITCYIVEENIKPKYLRPL